jgi:1,4-alpha-glucan branching enzyme
MVWIGDGEIVRFCFDHKANSQVYLVGDFNGWNETSHPMHKVKGKWILDLHLPLGEYEFKYLAGNIWYNDHAAHKYVPNCWGSENSVVVVTPLESAVENLSTSQL